MNSTKVKLKKFIRKLTQLPLLNRLSQIGVTLIRLPGLRIELLNLIQKQKDYGNDIENLLKSTPVTLRKITRNQIDAEHQILSLLNSVNYLLGRVEFVRRELMFEMRYGASNVSSSTEDKIENTSEILNKEKIKLAKTIGLRLNLGCGHIPLKDYLNVDRRKLSGVDIVAEVDNLPFEADQIDEIFSAHLLEHFPQEQLRRQLLPYWISLLKTDGVFHAVVPDAESMIKHYANGTYPYSSLREVTFGAQDYDGDFHYNMFVPEQLEELLMEAGLTDITWLAKGRQNGACLEMEFKALKI